MDEKVKSNGCKRYATDKDEARRTSQHKRQQKNTCGADEVLRTAEHANRRESNSRLSHFCPIGGGDNSKHSRNSRNIQGYSNEALFDLYTVNALGCLGHIRSAVCCAHTSVMLCLYTTKSLSASNSAFRSTESVGYM